MEFLLQNQTSSFIFIERLLTRYFKILLHKDKNEQLNKFKISQKKFDLSQVSL